MKNISIKISKDTVFDDIERRTAYIGSRSADESVYERITLTDVDKQEMVAYWDAAEPLLSVSFGEWLYSHTSDGEKCEFILKVTDNIGANAQNEIECASRKFMADSMLGQWCSVVMPERVEYYDTQATADLKNIQTALLNRQRPTR